MSEDTRSRLDRLRTSIAKSGAKKPCSPYPKPENETLLLSIPKHRGLQSSKLSMHERCGSRYLAWELCEISNGESILLRGVAIAPSEIEAVTNSLMDGYEMMYLASRGETSSVKYPHQLCALPRKNNTRELRVTLEEYENHQFLKLAVFIDEDDRWKPGKEWGTVSFHDLNDLLPALNSAREQFEASATEK